MSQKARDWGRLCISDSPNSENNSKLMSNQLGLQAGNQPIPHTFFTIQCRCPLCDLTPLVICQHAFGITTRLKSDRKHYFRAIPTNGGATVDVVRGQSGLIIFFRSTAVVFVTSHGRQFLLYPSQHVLGQQTLLDELIGKPLTRFQFNRSEVAHNAAAEAPFVVSTRRRFGALEPRAYGRLRSRFSFWSLPLQSRSNVGVRAAVESVGGATFRSYLEVVFIVVCHARRYARFGGTQQSSYVEDADLDDLVEFLLHVPDVLHIWEHVLKAVAATSE